MGRWMVKCSVQGEGYVLVDADTEIEAMGKAYAEDVTLTKAYDFDATYAFPYEPEPEPTPRAWSVTGRQAGEHVHVQVRHGQPGSRALLGTLVMRAAEWETFRAAMAPLTGEA